MAIVPPSDLTRRMIGVISRSLKPPKSIMAPKDMAPRISQTVESMLLMPPPEKSVSISGYAASSVKPLAMATQTLFSAAKRGAQAQIIGEGDHDLRLHDHRHQGARQRPDQDGQEGRIPADTEQQQHQHRQQVPQADVVDARKASSVAVVSIGGGVISLTCPIRKNITSEIR